MNSLRYDETKETIEAPFIDLASLAAEEKGDRRVSSARFARAMTDSFPGVDHVAARDTMSLRDANEPSSPGAAKALAAGILKQAARDVRRFRNATTAVEQGLYWDAYSWIAANDFSWPFSFLNVCESLHLVPGNVRSELLGNAPLGWSGYCRKIGSRITRALQSSFLSGSAEPGALEEPESNRSVPVSLWQ